MRVLGIESSCDDTGVAIVNSDKKILSHVLKHQLLEHAPYGGVVPELASRAHAEVCDKLVKQAMFEANIKSFNELDAIAVTSGPGLIGGLIVGVMTAKAISSVTKLPLIGVNHLEGHALTVRLTDDAPFPYLLLLISGGHCQFLCVHGVGKYTKIGGTMDDSLGEAFDKVAKMLKLGYPGGPIVEKLAKDGDPKAFNFPRSLKGRKNCDFSFSGLKTSVKKAVDELEIITQTDINNICASFQACISDIIIDRLGHAFKIYRKLIGLSSETRNTLVVAGGVAANLFLKNNIDNFCNNNNFILKTPPIKLCTDNGAMIAWAGLERLQLGMIDDIQLTPRARWPLDEI